MADCTLTRVNRRPDGIFGELASGSSFQCVTLEHAFEQADGTFAPALPAGTYTCQRRLSPHFNEDVFEILSVPGHDYVEIHPGNFNRDSKMCVLVGEAVADDGSEEMVTNSRATFDRFMALQSGVQEFQLSVI